MIWVVHRRSHEQRVCGKDWSHRRCPTSSLLPPSFTTMSTQPHRSQDTDGASSPRNFSELWNEALHRYKDETGKDLFDHTVANALLSSPSNAEEVMKCLDEQNQAFKAFRGQGQRVRVVLRTIVDAVLLIKDCAEVDCLQPCICGAYP